MKNAIAIRNLGPIASLELPIPEDGGVVVLHGRNGSGKSTAIDAAQAALSGDASGLVLRDEATEGEVSLGGVLVRVARKKTVGGQLEALSILGGDPSLIVDPGIQDPERADAARIRELCRLARVRPRIEAFEKVIAVASPQTVGAKTYKAESLPEMAALLRRDIQSAAREAEAQAEQFTGEWRAHEEQAKDAPTVAPDSAALQRNLEQAIGAQAKIKADKVNVAARIREAAKAKEALASAEGERDNSDYPRFIAGIEEQLREHEEQVARGKQILAKARADYEAQKRLDSMAKSWHEQIAAAANLEPISDEQVQHADAAVQAARVAIENAAVARKAIEAKGKSEIANKRQADATKRAEALRAAAEGVDGVLASELAAVLPNELSIRDGRLYAQDGPKLRLYGELSHGMRIRHALDMAISAGGEHPLIPIRQEFWEGLDEANRQAINLRAKERKAVVLTAACDAGDLRVEILQ